MRTRVAFPLPIVWSIPHAALVVYRSKAADDGERGQIVKNGNTLFGIPVYAQQATFFLSLVLTIVTLLYLQIVVKPLPRRTDGDTQAALPRNAGGKSE